ncbi:MAG: zinc-dependent alcohol dehydrogenase family protein [Burkholderiaceae bacterium]
MIKAQLNQFGNPADSVSLISLTEPGEPAAQQVLVSIDAAPINPAELLLIMGKYASRPPLPAPLGIEGAGTVLAVGPQVTDLSPGDKVMCLPRENWAEKALFERTELIRLPADIDMQQAAMLKVNPATALMMLRDYQTLSAGDWVIQNAANSGVGQNLICLAHAQGIKTVCVVRRESLVAELEAIGASVVLVDGPDLAERVRERIDGSLKLAIDAVGGEATFRLASCLDEEGTVVNYGLLSGENCQISADQAIFRGISLHGFWLAKQLRSMDGASVQSLYDGLATQVASGVLKVPVEKAYPLNEIAAALNHALQTGRDGKILLLPSRAG